MVSWGDAFSNRKSGLMGMTGLLNQNSLGAGCAELTKMPDRFWSNVNYFWLEDTHLLSFFRLLMHCQFIVFECLVKTATAASRAFTVLTLQGDTQIEHGNFTLTILFMIFPEIFN